VSTRVDLDDPALRSCDEDAAGDVDDVQAEVPRGALRPIDGDRLDQLVRVPALTTVRQPLAEMGRVAVSLLLRLLENQRVDALRIQLATKLVVRESTAPLVVRR
jgi:hypothetical protein